MPTPDRADVTAAVLPPRRPWRAWTEADLAIIRADYRTLGPGPLARRLDRHETTIRAKAKLLGLAHAPDPDAAYRRALDACRRDAAGHDGRPCPARVAWDLGLSIDHVQRVFRAIRDAGDWSWDVPPRARTRPPDPADADPTPEELAGIEARFKAERQAKVAAEDAARFVWPAGAPAHYPGGWTVPVVRRPVPGGR
jgi:hypothetical protein